MRTFDQLNGDEQEAAIDKVTEELVQAVCEGLRFNDDLNGNDLQARIDAAIAEAETMQTPWFAGEYVIDAAEEDLRSMARADAEHALYPAQDERVIRL